MRKYIVETHLGNEVIMAASARQALMLVKRDYRARGCQSRYFECWTVREAR